MFQSPNLIVCKINLFTSGRADLLLPLTLGGSQPFAPASFPPWGAWLGKAPGGEEAFKPEHGLEPGARLIASFRVVQFLGFSQWLVTKSGLSRWLNCKMIWK